MRTLRILIAGYNTADLKETATYQKSKKRISFLLDNI
jgi:hypothetical protein